MSLLRIHFMKVRGGRPWSFPPGLAHDKCLLYRESQAVLHWWLSLCRHFSVARFLHPDICPNPCPGAGKGGLWGTESWGEEMERFSSLGLVYTIAKTSWNCYFGIYFSHQIWKEILNRVYGFFRISVYKADMVAWFSTEQRRTSTLLFTNPNFDICMNLHSKELSTKIASGLTVCCIGWERITVGCSSAVGFWANTRFLLLGEYFCCTSCIDSSLLISLSSLCSLLDFLGRSHAWDLQLFLYMCDCCSKDKCEGKLLYVPVPANLLKVRDLRWLLLLPFLTTISQYEI